MKKVLVDTNIIIDYLRRKDKTKSLFFQIFSQKEYKALISLITITELWAGKSMVKKKVLGFVNKLVQKCELIPPSVKTAKIAGKMLRQSNYQISFQDARIAALAFENKLPILTLNKKDFSKIKGINFFKLSG